MGNLRWDIILILSQSQICEAGGGRGFSPAGGPQGSWRVQALGLLGGEQINIQERFTQVKRPPVHDCMNKHAPCCAAITAQEQVAGVTEAKGPFSQGLGPGFGSSS